MTILQFPIPAGGIPTGNTADRPASPVIGDVYYNGELGQLEIFDGTNFIPCSAPPARPSITAEDVGTDVAFGASQASVTFTADSTGGLVQGFTATSDLFSNTSTSNPVVLTMGNNGEKTISGTVFNGFGVSAPADNVVITTTTVPDRPTIGSFTKELNVLYGENSGGTINWTAPNTGGKTITGYTITTTPPTTTGTATAGATTSTVSGLVYETNYVINVTASNSNGTSLATSSTTISPSTVSDVPTIGTVTRINTDSVSIPFTAPTDDGNSTITSYAVTSTPALAGGFTITGGVTSPLTVTAITPPFVLSTSYTFQIAAVNAIGTSAFSTSSNSVTVNPSVNIDMLILAGGGGGQANFGAGAGAGGLVALTNQNINLGESLAVTVGAGGVAGSPNNGYVGNAGGDSSVAGFTVANGGGTGEGNGGCGGGGGGIGNQGTNGGTNSASTAKGGGGGQGNAGVNGSGSNTGGAGGAGTNAYSSWSGPGAPFGGGGGGIFGGAGGTGGGGGAGSSDPSDGGSGTVNTGGGGGGARGGNGVAGTGGSGFVTLRYLTGELTATGGTITTAGGYTYHHFTSSGTFERTA